MLRTAQALWKRCVPPSGRARLQHVVGPAVQELVFQLELRSKRTPIPGPVVVSGFFDEGFGIGRAGDATIAGLRNGGYEPLRHDLRPTLQADGFRSRSLFPDQPGGTWILHCNPPEAMVALSRLREENTKHRYRIGYWAYELPKAPKAWDRISRLFDEIWVPSEFVGLSLNTTTAIRVIPHYVPPKPMTADKQSEVRIGAGGDFRSSADRKNLRATLEIYAEAFPKPTPKQCLVLKTKNISEHGGTHLERRLLDRPDITVIDSDLSEDAMNALVSSFDIYLSPHRSEGFGLVLLEAMAQGIPALATGWSGNLEFMADVPELLLDYSLVPVRDSAGIYAREGSQVWAEPIIQNAAAKLRELSNSRDYRLRLGNRCREIAAKVAHSWDADQLTLKFAPRAP